MFIRDKSENLIISSSFSQNKITLERVDQQWSFLLDPNGLANFDRKRREEEEELERIIQLSLTEK